ncbi:MAG: PEP-utilizing enzyme, partial [Candidatus Cryptobacteroides sp.]|nr:PEP-utilizing enzyme [Candidatus Cryptobacteroides sp.]
MTSILKSNSSVGGLAMGTARVLVRETRGSEARTLPEAMDRERERLRSLIAGSSSPDIFSAHLEMLDDPLLQETIESNIAEGMAPREAVEATAEGIAAMLSGCGDDYMAARADDVRDVCRGIVESLCGDSSNQFADIPDDSVLVAEELFPSDTARMDFSKVRALVTRKGSVTSHVCIIARSRGVPVVLGVDIDSIKDGDYLLVDGGRAEVRINPTEKETETFRKGIGNDDTFPDEIRRLVRESGIRIFANAGSVEDIKEAIAGGAEGIGLFRTEFLFMDRKGLPPE